MKRKLNSITIGLTYIGVVVGAGFASGQEVLRFFGEYGWYGLVGIIITTLFFVYFGYIIMALGYKIKADSHGEILAFIQNKTLRIVSDYVLTVFLLGGFTAMIAGSGAMVEQFFGIPYLYGALFMALLSIITVWLGIEGIITSISMIVPFLLSSVLFICIYTITKGFQSIDFVPVTKNTLSNNFIYSSMLYVSYNTIFSIGILAPLGKQAKSLNTIKKGALLGGVGLGLGALGIYISLMTDIHRVFSFEIPMLYIASKIAYSVAAIYSLVLIAEIYSTAVGNLYAFTARLIDVKKRVLYRTFIIIVSVIALLLSLLGFSNIVRYYYRFEGVVGLAILFILIYNYIKYNRK